MGTIYAFGYATLVYSSGNSEESMLQVFRANFFDAAFTTILGGSIYVLNLMIATFIEKNLHTQKR